MTEPHPLRGSLLLAVAAGGAVGACLRWLLGSWSPAGAGDFPWTTFGINVGGSVLLALLPTVPAVRRHPVLPPALGAGLLGGFTTLSAYSEETRLLLASGHTGLASAYLLGTLAACLLGVALVQRLTTSADRAAVEADGGDR